MAKNEMNWKGWALFGFISGLVNSAILLVLGALLGIAIAGVTGMVIGLEIGLMFVITLSLISAVAWAIIGVVYDKVAPKAMTELTAFWELSALMLIINILSSVATGTFSMLFLVAAMVSTMVSLFFVFMIFRILGQKLPVK